MVAPNDLVACFKLLHIKDLVRSRFRAAIYLQSLATCFNTGGLHKGVYGAGYFGGGIRIASQHSAILESLGGCGNDDFFAHGIWLQVLANIV